MKSSILPLALFVIIFSNCTTAYKSGQTPDDVYFSPTRPEEEHVKKETREDQHATYEDYEDHYLRMKVRNRYRWNDLDDPYYYRKTYSYNYYSCCQCQNSWTPYAYWNYYYNPYYRNIGSNPKAIVYSAPRKVNLATYNPQPAVSNTKTYTSPRNATGSTNNTYTAPRNNTRSNEDGNSGNLLRDLFNSGGNKNNTSPGNSNTSSNNNSGSSSSSSNSSSGSSAPVRKF